MESILSKWYLCPFYGYRRIHESMKQEGMEISKKRIRRLMEKIELRAIYPKPRLTKARKEHEKYKYLLRNKQIRYPNQVWASDITYIKLKGGSHAYLVVIIDLYSRKVLSWRFSNTLDKYFCMDALNEAIKRYGIPAIFNTDQGCQFTSDEFTGILKEKKVEISMNGKGRALDNVFVERFFRSLKCEKIYINTYSSMKTVKQAIKDYIKFYNSERPHQGLEYFTPDKMVQSFVDENERKLAA